MENRENNIEIFDGNTTFSYAAQLLKRHVNTERPGTEANIYMLCLVVCFTLLASSFISSASLINMYQYFFSAFCFQPYMCVNLSINNMQYTRTIDIIVNAVFGQSVKLGLVHSRVPAIIKRESHKQSQN